VKDTDDPAEAALDGEAEVARITEVDITGAARALAVLRWSDFLLVVGCGSIAVATVPETLLQVYRGQLSAAGMSLAMILGFGFVTYTGWRHVGVIEPRVWRAYLWVFPLLSVVAGALALGSISTFVEKGWHALDEFSWFIQLGTALQFVGIAIPGFVCILLLRRWWIPAAGMTLRALLEGLTARAGAEAQRLKLVPRAQLVRGLLFGLAGAAVLITLAFLPMTTEGGRPSTFLRANRSISLFGFFLLVRGRRYFQVSADSLLAIDKRSPILFLRSFADDERQRYRSSQRALLDFSLETRLANHFQRFGPFIAIGSPKDKIPQPGAARVRLKDEEWKARVQAWMNEAKLIIMYCGTTESVNWELRRVVDIERATNLIVMFPEIKSWRRSVRRQDIALRVKRLREVFGKTKWTEELTAFDEFEGARAMIFRADGSMLIVKSRSRSRDAYHLAALVAHQQLLDPAGAVQTEPAQGRALRRWTFVIAGAATAAMLAAGGALLAKVKAATPNHGTLLSFGQSGLYYQSPVSEAAAKRVGEALLQKGYLDVNRAVTVQLVQQADRYQLRFVVGPSGVIDQEDALQLEMTGMEISAAALARGAVDVVLCDQQLEPTRVLPRTTRLDFSGGQVYYTAPVTAQDAQLVGNVLADTEFFSAERKPSVHLGREEGTNQIRFFSVNPSSVNDPEILAGFSALGSEVARTALGGRPLVLHLCDGQYQSLRQVRVDPGRDVAEAQDPARGAVLPRSANP
jgi:hypothetical protein